MNKTTAIAELSALLKHQSDGYYLYLSNGGKNDPNVEMELDAINFAIRCLQDLESLRPKGRWEWNKDHWECTYCGGGRFHDLVLGLDAAFCGRCGAKMEG